jgi:carbonic anhydrase
MKKFSAVFLLILISSCFGKWSYEGRSGAQHWGDLKEEFKFCKIGYNQSPIDVKYDFEESDLKFSYSLSDVEKTRENYVMKINFYGQNFLLRGKKKYFLENFEFHHPSEHLINSQAHSLELQITHKSEDEQLLKLAIFLEVGKENEKFDYLIKLLSAKEKDSKIDLSKIVKADDKIFFYDGSSTTPPCREGVKWYVMKTPIQISKEQMNQIIKSAIFTKTNARPVQKFHPEKY